MHEPEHARITRLVGKRIREVRRDRGISQQDLADLADVHATNIGRLERGVGNPKLDTLARIAVSLDASLSELVQDITMNVVHAKESRRISAKDLIRAREALADSDKNQKEGPTKQ